MPRQRAQRKTCILCFNKQKDCSTGTLSGCCSECCRAKPPLPTLVPSFLTEDLIRTVTCPPDAASSFPICSHPACKHAALSIWDHDRGNALPVELPLYLASPLEEESRHVQEQLDTFVTELRIPRGLDPAATREWPQSAMLVLRYLSIFCPTSMTTSEGPDASAKTFLLGYFVLARLSMVLSSALVDITKQTSRQKSAEPSAVSSGLALLYTALSEVRTALEAGQAKTLISEPGFQPLFTKQIQEFVDTLHPFVAQACAAESCWWEDIGEERVDQLRFPNWSSKLHLVLHSCPHKSLTMVDSSEMWRTGSILTNFTTALDLPLYSIPVPPTTHLSQHHIDLRDFGDLAAFPPRDGDGEPNLDDLDFDLDLPRVDDTSALAALFLPPVPSSTLDLYPPDVNAYFPTGHLVNDFDGWPTPSFPFQGNPFQGQGVPQLYRQDFVAACLNSTLTIQERAEHAFGPEATATNPFSSSRDHDFPASSSGWPP